MKTGLATYSLFYTSNHEKWNSKVLVFLVTCICVFVDIASPCLLDRPQIRGLRPIGNSRVPSWIDSELS